MGLAALLGWLLAEAGGGPLLTFSVGFESVDDEKGDEFQYSDIIAREIPDVEYALIPKAGHAAMWERAGVFNSLILGFMAKQSA